MRALKDDQIVPTDPPSLMSDYIAELIKRDLAKLPFARIFEKKPSADPDSKQLVDQDRDNLGSTTSSERDGAKRTWTDRGDLS